MNSPAEARNAFTTEAAAADSRFQPPTREEPPAAGVFPAGSERHKSGTAAPGGAEAPDPPRSPRRCGHAASPERPRPFPAPSLPLRARAASISSSSQQPPNDGSRHEQRARCPLRLLPWVEPTVQLGDPGSEASALSPRSHRLPAPRRRKPRGKRRPRCQPCRGRKEEGDGREVSERRQQRYLLPSWGGTLPPGRKRSSALLGVVFHGWEVPNNSRKTLSRVCSASRCRRDRNFGISAKSLLSVLSKMTK
ncbi:uncharacterized protein LOC142363901 [Opisthocomus hoazin]|uniref:uncharacterized protein LOC142363901 n=1 Tax=Opisthocomus hoazin TaxID=30419 RepID=UPI003F52C65E